MTLLIEDSETKLGHREVLLQFLSLFMDVLVKHDG